MPSYKTRVRILGVIREDAYSWLIPLLVFLVGGLLTFLLTMANVDFHQRQVQQRFDMLADERVSRIQERLVSQMRRLDTLRRFFVYSADITEAEFNGFVRPMLIQTQAYSWTPKVTDAQRQSFEQQALGSGAVGFSVRQLDDQGVLVPAAHRPVYYPVRYAQSHSTGELPLGFDVNSETVRQATLERSLRSRSMTASPRIALVGLEAENADGVLLVVPVLSKQSSAGVEAGDLQGFVMAVISLRTIMAEGLPPSLEDKLALTLVDVTEPQAPNDLYRSVALGVGGDLLTVKALAFAGRSYQLQIEPTSIFIAGNPSSNTSLILLGGSLSFMFSALLYALMSQRRRALQLVVQRTQQLRQREQQLRSAHGQLRNVLDAATQVAIIATDLNGLITTFNIGAEKMLGYDSDQVCGTLTLSQLHLPAELNHLIELTQRRGRVFSACEVMLVDAVEKHGHQTRDWTFVRRDGSRVRVSMQVSHVLDEQDQWIGYLAVCLDITERKRVEDELRTMSVTDALTGVYNRRYFQERLQAELQRVVRHGGIFSVVMLDIDHFKAVNDQWGHAVGDHVLQVICQRIAQRLEHRDVFCRLGGEEFMVLSPESDMDQAQALATELWTALRDEPVEGVGVITASFGIATWREGEGADALLLRADAGVYAAKMAGRDRVEPQRA